MNLNSTIFAFLAVDGLTNGAIYALLGLALVLVFAVTRIIFVPQGELVAFGALTYALLEIGKAPRITSLLIAFGLAAFALFIALERKNLTTKRLMQEAIFCIALPFALLFLTKYAVQFPPHKGVNVFLTLSIIAPLGVYLYRIAFQPIADASVLTLFITSIGVHLALMGLGLYFFGAEGLRAEPLSSEIYRIGTVMFKGQAMAIYALTAGVMVGLYMLFNFTIFGKALRATAVNRVGARLVGIRTTLSGQIAFMFASIIGALSGILIIPSTTLYYDSGFLIGLKGFVAAIIGGLVSYPLTALAALIVGLVEGFSAFYASDFKEIIVFTLLLPVLLWRSFAHPPHEEEEE
jgi:branched-chain amino acid transport system permease protein